MAKPIRVFGKADSFDIELTPNGEKWEVDIPPDMTDGVYAVQLTAISIIGEKAHWVGELYMTNGVCCLNITETPYSIKFRSKEYQMNFHKNEYGVSYHSSVEVDFWKNYIVQIKKRQWNESNYMMQFVTGLKVNNIETLEHKLFKSKEAEMNSTKFNSEYMLKTELNYRKGCCCG
jgi:hypothetical protein